MEIPKLNDLEPFLKKCLNASEILNYDTKFLTNPGDNYGSIMLEFTIRYRTIENDDEKTLNIVAKTPIRNESFKVIFKPHQTCLKENRFYVDAVPEMLQVQRDAGIPEAKLCDVYVHCYGARSSLDPNATEADNDAMLLLENLTLAGYRTGDRRTGFSAKFSFRIIEKLAEFHALPIAVRTLKPDRFDEKIRPCLDVWNNEGWDILNTSKSLIIAINSVQWNQDEESIRDRFIHQLHLLPNTITSDIIVEDGPFISIHHQDYWVNNIMYKLDSTGESIDKIKIVDYQVMKHDSLALDIVFFLFTSVKSIDLDANFDDLLRHYYDHFCKTLTDVGCSVEEYSFEKLQMELKEKAKNEIFHIMMMMRVLMAPKDSITDLSELDRNVFYKEDFVQNDYYERIKNIILLFDRKGLLP